MDVPNKEELDLRIKVLSKKDRLSRDIVKQLKKVWFSVSQSKVIRVIGYKTKKNSLRLLVIPM